MSAPLPDTPFRPTNRRQRLKIIALTAAVLVLLWWLLLFRPGAQVRQFPETRPKACDPGQTQGCVGGQATVLLLPASASAASTPR